MPRPKTYREFPVQIFQVIRGPSGHGIREIQFTYLFVDGMRTDSLWGPNLIKFDNRIWSSKGMKSMEEYLAAAPWAVRWSMKDRGDFRISLVKKAKNWATTRGIPKEPAYQVYASIDSQALSHVINQEFAEWGRGR